MATFLGYRSPVQYQAAYDETSTGSRDILAGRFVSLDPGATIDDKYRVQRLIGAGGMGQVYEAENLRIGRRVAIKVLQRANREDVARFEREARAASQIGSRNIIQVFDLGDLPDATPYMVMEYLEGESLAARLQAKGRLGPSELLPIAHQVLEGLKAAHAAGIVHRDLKPDNVFLAVDRAGDEYVKLLDFGISKFRTREGDTSGLTRPGFAIGTPHFMSPEQLNASLDVDGRADLYAVGVLLYLCLSGSLPFEADSFEALMVKILFRGATPLRSVMPSLSTELAAVVAKAMARSPADRFQTAAEFQAALAACQPGAFADTVAHPGLASTRARGPAPRAATPGSWASTSRRLGGLNRQRVLSVTVAVLGASLGVVVGTLALRKSRAPAVGAVVASSAAASDVLPSAPASAPAAMPSVAPSAESAESAAVPQLRMAKASARPLPAPSSSAARTTRSSESARGRAKFEEP